MNWNDEELVMDTALFVTKKTNALCEGESFA